MKPILFLSTYSEVMFYWQNFEELSHSTRKRFLMIEKLTESENMRKRKEFCQKAKFIISKTREAGTDEVLSLIFSNQI